ncbi:class I SAM-dependent methyltransferase [Salinispirillum sp. LH 10-3-1]|uniref:Class I SAM-dependent methyltransferase n=1 Tax=Salinispirillum sp. LH 10-3-1 TaxID=2952525 RepID=A0AB38YJ97_9GAMM
MSVSQWYKKWLQWWRPAPLQPHAREVQLNRWYRTELGEALYRTERDMVAPVLAQGYHPFIVQVDGGLYRPLFDAQKCRSKAAVLISRYENNAVCPTVQSDPEHLALLPETVDMMIMHHVIEYAQNPHRVLREAVQALRPGGQLIVMGFNPYGFWGLARLLRRQSQVPWVGRFVSARRVADWCTLLDCDEEQTAYYYHWPPMTQASWKRRVRLLNAFFRVVMPMTGAGYMLVVRKNQVELLHDHKWKPAFFMQDKVMTTQREQVTG